MNSIAIQHLYGIYLVDLYKHSSKNICTVISKTYQFFITTSGISNVFLKGESSSELNLVSMYFSSKLSESLFSLNKS